MTAGRVRACGADERGQATVELALGLPVVLLLLLALAQVVVVVHGQIMVVHAAREGARAAAVAADAVGEGRRAVIAALGGPGAGSTTIAVVDTGERVDVTVTRRVPTDIPLIGAFVGDVTVVGRATMAAEP